MNDNYEVCYGYDFFWFIDIIEDVVCDLIVVSLVVNECDGEVIDGNDDVG